MSLHAVIDDVPLADAEARALWQRFSAWMEEKAGDLGGFARSEGFLSVHPQMRTGDPVLVLSHTTPQGGYAPAGRASEPLPARAAQPKRPRRRSR